MIGTIEERFWAKVNKRGRCWLWTGTRNSKGYGSLNPGGRDGSPLRAHRISWEIHFGTIPPGLCVLHRCDRPSCVNPFHLFLGTNAENSLDMARKGRTTRAKLTPAKVTAIRRLRSEKSLTYKEIAAKFGVTKYAIEDIASGRSWAWL